MKLSDSDLCKNCIFYNGTKCKLPIDKKEDLVKWSTWTGEIHAVVVCGEHFERKDKDEKR